VIVIEDNDLLAFRHGDNHAMKKVFDTYHQQIYIYAFNLLRDQHEAEDVVAQALEALWRNRSSINNTHHLGSYLYTLTKHLSIDVLRKKKRSTTYITAIEGNEDSYLAEEETSIYDRLDAVVKATLMEKMLEEIGRMAPQRKKVMQLLLASKSVVEIARSMRVGIKSVYTHKYEAFKQIRHILRMK